MPYYTIDGIGDYLEPHQIHPEDAAKVLDDLAGPYYIDEDETGRYRVDVYKTPEEAWAIIFGRIDYHLQHMNKVRAELALRAKNSGYEA